MSKNNAVKLARALEQIFGAGLFIDDSDDGLRYENAIMHVASAQLRAVNVALIDPDPEPHHSDSRRRGWSRKSGEFTEHDAFAAIGAVATLLDVARDILPTMRATLEAAEEHADEKEDAS